MRNNSFNKLEKADKMVDSFLKVAISLDLICALLLLIGGILVCALVDVGTGIGYIISALIMCGFGVFLVYLSHSLLTVFVDGMNDIKTSGIAIDELKSRQNIPEINIPKAFEQCTNFYLYYSDKGMYLSLSAIESQTVSVVKDLQQAIKFQTEEEALRFAEYKRLTIGDKWTIIKKNLIIPLC